MRSRDISSAEARFQVERYSEDCHEKISDCITLYESHECLEADDLACQTLVTG
jgi:hypothetical protein